MRWFFLAAVVLTAASCHPVRNAASKYYNRNSEELAGIERDYASLYSLHPFSMGFLDRKFKDVSFEVITDTLKYAYDLPLGSARMRDTLQKFGFDTGRIEALANRMKAIKCLWLNKSEYYADAKRHVFTYVSVKPVVFNMPFTDQKYYLIIYFDKPQRFNRRGHLIGNRKFVRITDNTCFTFASQFRN